MTDNDQIVDTALGYVLAIANRDPAGIWSRWSDRLRTEFGQIDPADPSELELLDDFHEPLRQPPYDGFMILARAGRIAAAIRDLDDGRVVVGLADNPLGVRIIDQPTPALPVLLVHQPDGWKIDSYLATDEAGEALRVGHVRRPPELN